eukprot:2626640-Heterocapsa_arctica.AAC.1
MTIVMGNLALGLIARGCKAHGLLRTSEETLGIVPCGDSVEYINSTMSVSVVVPRGDSVEY